MGTQNAERFEEKVSGLHEAWLSIKPPVAARCSHHSLLFLGADVGADGHLIGRWALLKASATFQEYYRRNERFT